MCSCSRQRCLSALGLLSQFLVLNCAAKRQQWCFYPLYTMKHLLTSPNKAMEPKIWSQTQLQPWLPGICPLTLIGLWSDPAINSSKRDNVDAYFVFHWMASCVALSHVFLASHSPSSWQVPLFNFYLPALQSSCLCVGLCWKTETRPGALVLAFPLAFHPSFPLSQSSVVCAACVSWALLWSCSFSQMLQEHPHVKRVEQRQS